MTQMIIFIIFAAVLEMAITGAIGTIIVGQKGRNIYFGLVIGALCSIFGLIFLAFMDESDLSLATKMYDRKILSLQEYEDTKEFIVAGKHQTPKHKLKN